MAGCTNLGLEIAWNNYQTILVSDRGGKMAAEPEPKHNLEAKYWSLSVVAQRGTL
jgi:hypothetical protein